MLSLSWRMELLDVKTFQKLWAIKTINLETLSLKSASNAPISSRKQYHKTSEPIFCSTYCILAFIKDNTVLDFWIFAIFENFLASKILMQDAAKRSGLKESITNTYPGQVHFSTKVFRPRWCYKNFKKYGCVKTVFTIWLSIYNW